MKSMSLYGSRFENTGRKHCQTKEPISKPEIVHVYSKFMECADLNDKFLKYSALSWHCLKWWKSVLLFDEYNR